MTKATKHSHNRMRLFTGIGVVALLASVCGSTAAGASSSAAKGKAYTLSVVEDLSGPDAQNGQPQLAAAKAAVWEIDHTGGINGHPLTITSVQDSQSTEAGAETALRTALGNQTNFTTSSFAGGIAAGTNALYTSAGIPYVGDTYPSPTTLDEPWYFTLAPTAQQVAAGTVNALKSASGGSIKGKVIGFEGFNDPVVIGNLNAAKKLIVAAGGKIGPTILDPLTVTSWTSQAANVASDHVGGFIINTTEADTAVVGKALVVAGVTVPIVSTEGASSDALFKAVGASNFYAVRETSQTAVSAGTVPGAAAKKAGYGSANTGYPLFGRMYGAIYAAAAALKKCGYPCSSSSFETALEKLGPYTPPNGVFFGPVHFTNSNHAGLTTASVYGWNASQGVAVRKGAPFALK